MELDFTVTNEWQGLSDQKNSNVFTVSKKMSWTPFLSAE